MARESAPAIRRRPTLAADLQRFLDRPPAGRRYDRSLDFCRSQTRPSRPHGCRHWRSSRPTWTRSALRRARASSPPNRCHGAQRCGREPRGHARAGRERRGSRRRGPRVRRDRVLDVKTGSAPRFARRASRPGRGPRRSASDGRHLASVGCDGAVRLWNAANRPGHDAVSACEQRRRIADITRRRAPRPRLGRRAGRNLALAVRPIR